MVNIGQCTVQMHQESQQIMVCFQHLSIRKTGTSIGHHAFALQDEKTQGQDDAPCLQVDVVSEAV